MPCPLTQLDLVKSAPAMLLPPKNKTSLCCAGLNVRLGNESYMYFAASGVSAVRASSQGLPSW